MDISAGKEVGTTGEGEEENDYEDEYSGLEAPRADVFL